MRGAIACVCCVCPPHHSARLQADPAAHECLLKDLRGWRVLPATPTYYKRSSFWVAPSPATPTHRNPKPSVLASEPLSPQSPFTTFLQTCIPPYLPQSPPKTHCFEDPHTPLIGRTKPSETPISQIPSLPPSSLSSSAFWSQHLFLDPPLPAVPRPFPNPPCPPPFLPFPR